MEMNRNLRFYLRLYDGWLASCHGIAEEIVGAKVLRMDCGYF